MVTSSREVADPTAGRVRARMLRRVERRVRELLTDEGARWAAVHPRGGALVDAVDTLVRAGGKRLRPAFCLTGFLAGGGDPADEVAVDAAAALELLHAFALLHDDVMDDAPVRRGAPTAHARHAADHRGNGWRGEARRYGESVAILAGDLAYSYADRLVAPLPVAARQVWADLVTEMIVGQYLDIAAAAESMLDAELCRWIAVGKSGAYSIYRPLVLGAAVAGRTDLGPAFHEYGIALGEAFQLRDDLIDAYGDADVAGKPTRHDLQQHKMTMLLVLAARKDPRIAAAVAAEEWNDAELRALLDECDVRADVERRIDHLVATARAAVAGIDVPPAWCAELSAMALQVAYRDR